MSHAGVVLEGPVDGALVHQPIEATTKHFDLLVGEFQSAWDHILFHIGDGGRSPVVNTNDACIRIKRGWTHSQIWKISFSLIVHDGEGTDTLLRQSWRRRRRECVAEGLSPRRVGLSMGPGEVHEGHSSC